MGEEIRRTIVTPSSLEKQLQVPSFSPSTATITSTSTASSTPSVQKHNVTMAATKEKAAVYAPDLDALGGDATDVKLDFHGLPLVPQPSRFKDDPLVSRIEKSIYLHSCASTVWDNFTSEQNN